jgi:hypothetical protein
MLRTTAGQNKKKNELTADGTTHPFKNIFKASAIN